MTSQTEQAGALARRIEEQLNQVLVGQPAITRQVLIALITGGHVLIEGVPGLGKTLLARSLARVLELDFQRIQFTPDLMPSDVTGHALFDSQSGDFRVRKGPAFTNLLLADEINRAPAKTQAALLEVMQERQITIEGESFPLAPPFVVLATQNPLDQEGTYPLPEAELDRFLFKILIDYPDQAHESRMVEMVLDGRLPDSLDAAQLTPVTDAAGILELTRSAEQVLIDPALIDYLLRLVRATREHPSLIQGGSPRASIALARTAKTQALLSGRDFVVPDDVKAVAAPVLRHRLRLGVDAELEGQTVESVLAQLLEQVEAPRQ
ncbi:MAG: MoxR family ATPase [Alloalcanivorax venustensis]|jgi:MoxR-like ATPase|uniref:ATPase AAA n=2 Tax=Alloalcanivorax venustensis TaxID=172371 RepID=A0ABS0AJB7_9GAMM|nr:MoxR family ATPase [Alloalcanivorax venustensis]KXJ47316.1 MAG: AAA family ATPase [Alcanivorax sp. Nap_24]MAD69599.1 AAA family ATPase [Alcanivorax sp.]MCH9783974.1 MoxR family ATPase [Gammaproteobacteria bacterium]MEC8880777.1 MoxR family ATPase [Pseudomonadota bacterium]SMO78120.1 MoxR-like ATPase [Alcanivorax sp. DSM 26295]|tara:strand:- start:19815 stop:20780 length:966 start_codon:yes stop_codon:yes gene_type:complete